MSSLMRENGRAMREASCNGIVRRMVSLPRNILGGVSRAMGHGIDLMGITGRRNQLPPQPNFPFPSPQEQPPVQEEWAFLASFEQQYGTTHPFFYACRFEEALKIAQDEHKFVFIYLHSPEHPFTSFFCRETLSSEAVVQFLDTNFVCWAALANRGEGLHMATILKPPSFPYCAVVVPASGDSITVLQQMEGPVLPADFVEIMQRTLEEQGRAFGSGWAKEEEKRRADRRLREKQDAAYLAALQNDQQKERRQNLNSEERAKKKVEASDKGNHKNIKENPTIKQESKIQEATTSRDTKNKDAASSRGKDAQATKILIRFPNGERKEQSFVSTDKIQAVYRYIDSLGLPGVGNYRLVSSFPRKIYGVDQMGMTLKDAGLHPRASLFLELL